MKGVLGDGILVQPTKKGIKTFQVPGEDERQLNKSLCMIWSHMVAPAVHARWLMVEKSSLSTVGGQFQLGLDRIL